MTEDEVRAAAERLVEFHERFAPHFGKEQAQDHAYTYVGCNRATATGFPGIRVVFCPQGPSVPLLRQPAP